MKATDKIKERVQIGLRISEPDYFIGLIYLLNCLYEDYFKYVQEENRLKGIMLRYQEQINKSFLDFFGEVMTEDRYEFCGKIVFLYRNIVYNEFRYMNKRLSPADRIMVIIKRIFEFIFDRHEEDFNESIVSINEISTSLYDNIRWKQKQTDLHRFMKILDTYFSEGYIGKQPLWKYSLREEQERFTKKYQELSESEVLVENETESQVSVEL